MAFDAGRYNILLVSVSFAVLFSAYNTLQNYATSLFPTGLGNQSLGVLYGSVALTVFAGPPMVDALGTRVTMVIGAACYVAYMISLIRLIREVVLVFSVIIGFGAAVLWVALGVFIAQNSAPEEYASNTGLFWAIFQARCPRRRGRPPRLHNRHAPPSPAALQTTARPPAPDQQHRRQPRHVLCFPAPDVQQ